MAAADLACVAAGLAPVLFGQWRVCGAAVQCRVGVDVQDLAENLAHLAGGGQRGSGRAGERGRGCHGVTSLAGLTWRPGGLVCHPYRLPGRCGPLLHQRGQVVDVAREVTDRGHRGLTGKQLASGRLRCRSAPCRPAVTHPGEGRFAGREDHGRYPRGILPAGVATFRPGNCRRQRCPSGRTQPQLRGATAASIKAISSLMKCACRPGRRRAGCPQPLNGQSACRRAGAGRHGHIRRHTDRSCGCRWPGGR